jgi:hypothetical protein
MTLLNDAGPSYGRLWTPEGMQARLRHVILDEADLLLTSAYSKPVMQILQVGRHSNAKTGRNVWKLRAGTSAEALHGWLVQTL